ncbi:hypothetical protein IKF26_01255 [Candidatus Saccharibacteria bacterium]|nr:hypothetical protein [Candidatus Saccharibacteria bacterium]
MIKVFTGNDRIRAKNEIEKFLGKNYEIIEGTEITPNDLPSIFLGVSLFSSARNILIRDVSANKAVFEKVSEYLNTPHNVALFELKLDKRSVGYKNIKNKVEIFEFSAPQNPNLKIVFDIYKTAKTDGKKAVDLLEKIKFDEDPMMFFGLLVSQALKDYSAKQGIKEKRTLKELSKLDLKLKTTSFEPWLLIQSFLLRLSSLQ